MREGRVTHRFVDRDDAADFARRYLEVAQSPREVPALAGTRRLDARMGASGLHVEERVALCLVEDTTDLDGVWWEIDDVHFAPFGSILPGRLAHWHAQRVEPGALIEPER